MVPFLILENMIRLMKFNFKTNLFWGILPAIILGAVGSGVWEYVFKPALTTASKLILDLATLGVDTFKDDLYREIAIGLHEKLSNALYFEFNLVICSLLIALSVLLAKKVKQAINEKSELMEKIQRLDEGTEKRLPSLDELKQGVMNIKPERLLVPAYVLIIAAVIVGSAQFVSGKRDDYVNSAIVHYIQLKRIVSPYIAHNEILQLDSRFSQIQSAKDYESIIFQMSNIAKQHGAIVPKFEVW